ncbi:hypothetical protein KKA14_00830 [bacterium]|nr:hypothetical protein [bacterium]
MEKVIYLDDYKVQKTVERISRFWKGQFDEDYDARFGFSSISNKTLVSLARPEEQNTFVWYRLIMQVLGLEGSLDFSALQSLDKLLVIDIQFYLVDRVRFEMMKRLGWLEDYNGESASLIEIIGAFEHFQHEDHQHPPRLSKTHKNYKDFKPLISREKVVFVRKLFPELLPAFEKMISSRGFT